MAKALLNHLPFVVTKYVRLTTRIFKNPTHRNNTQNARMICSQTTKSLLHKCAYSSATFRVHPKVSCVSCSSPTSKKLSSTVAHHFLISANVATSETARPSLSVAALR